MKRLIVAALLALPVAVTAAVARTHGRSDDGGDLLLRVNAPVALGPRDSVGAVRPNDSATVPANR